MSVGCIYVTCAFFCGPTVRDLQLPGAGSPKVFHTGTLSKGPRFGDPWNMNQEHWPPQLQGLRADGCVLCQLVLDVLIMQSYGGSQTAANTSSDKPKFHGDTFRGTTHLYVNQDSYNFHVTRMVQPTSWGAAFTKNGAVTRVVCAGPEVTLHMWSRPFSRGPRSA